jgi:hypothetical protein
VAPRVSSYAIDDDERLLLFDPLAVPGELEELARSRRTAVGSRTTSSTG